MIGGNKKIEGNIESLLYTSATGDIDRPISQYGAYEDIHHNTSGGIHLAEKENQSLSSLKSLEQGDGYMEFNHSGLAKYNIEEPTQFERLQNSRLSNIRLGMDTIESIASQRVGITRENLDQIESDILKCRNQLLEMDGLRIGLNKAADQRRLSIEQRLFDLYREKRAEESSCWRDQLWLKRDLISLLKEYLDLERRKTLISEILEDNYSVGQNDDRGAMPKTQTHTRRKSRQTLARIHN